MVDRDDEMGYVSSWAEKFGTERSNMMHPRGRSSHEGRPSLRIGMGEAHVGVVLVLVLRLQLAGGLGKVKFDDAAPVFVALPGSFREGLRPGLPAGPLFDAQLVCRLRCASATPSLAFVAPRAVRRIRSMRHPPRIDDGRDDARVTLAREFHRVPSNQTPRACPESRV